MDGFRIGRFDSRSRTRETHKRVQYKSACVSVSGFDKGGLVGDQPRRGEQSDRVRCQLEPVPRHTGCVQSLQVTLILLHINYNFDVLFLLALIPPQYRGRCSISSFPFRLTTSHFFILSYIFYHGVHPCLFTMAPHITVYTYYIHTYF